MHGYELCGKVFAYDTNHDLKAYSNLVDSVVSIVYIGGLGSHMAVDAFTVSLEKYCSRNGYRFVIPQLRSHPHFGLFTIDDDAEDLNGLLMSLEGDVVLVGNSTGCQDIIHYLKVFGNSNVKLAVLQGAVSDVEYEEHVMNDLGKYLHQARGMSKDAVMNYRGMYIKAQRFMDLFCRYGKEDMFSSYLSDEFFMDLNTMNTRILFVVSGKDEYSVSDIMPKLKLVSNSSTVCIPEGTHLLCTGNDISLFLGYLDKEIIRVLNVESV
ncbi:hypothetical protein HK407_09g13680 [Ordospora pajunii]|uniref:uncharacterized protein n=1 Tax=Ordospora pajunii TaxID=3039483 RepID=UPI0029525E95|nr:uncharacterized protein HK407_09g13680 [Ordospora pajunii]KAH9410955.1 hypothetical protein HK407_09g13680 [Ordospora pajunii]